MKINIKYTGLDSTPAMNQYVEEKVGGIEKFLKRLAEKGAAEANVEVARATNHHHKGDVYHVECNLTLPGKLIRAETESFDLRAGVDEVRETLDVELKKYFEKVRPQDNGGQKELRKLRGKD